MKINNRLGVEFVSGSSGRFSASHTLRVWALNRLLTDAEVFMLCDLAGFWGEKTIVRRWVEKPEDHDCNKFSFAEVRNVEDSSG